METRMTIAVPASRHTAVPVSRHTAVPASRHRAAGCCWKGSTSGQALAETGSRFRHCLCIPLSGCLCSLGDLKAPSKSKGGFWLNLDAMPSPWTHKNRHFTLHEFRKWFSHFRSFMDCDHEPKPCYIFSCWHWNHNVNRPNNFKDFSGLVFALRTARDISVRTSKKIRLPGIKAGARKQLRGTEVVPPLMRCLHEVRWGQSGSTTPHWTSCVLLLVPKLYA